MITFTAAVFFLLITPGPGVLSLAGVGSSFGYRDGMRYLVGLCIGSNLVMLAVAAGLAAVLLADDRIRVVLMIASFGYLLYLAAKIALAGSEIAFIGRLEAPGIRGGLALQAINPKAYVVGTSLFSGFPFLEAAPTTEMLLKFIIINAIWIPIHVLWLWAGVSLRRLNPPARVQRAINIAMALSMLMVVGLAALSA